MENLQCYTLEGIWQADIGDGKLYEMSLPGTLDENEIGFKDTGSIQWHPDAELGNAEEGFEKNAPIATRFTRKYTYEGEVRLTRKISFEAPIGKRVFLEVERARCLRLLVDGKEVPDFVTPSISTPHVFEVTEAFGNKSMEAKLDEGAQESETQGMLVQEIKAQGAEAAGEHEICLLSDNSYPGLPHDAIVYSSAATDETQTNWNGVLGYVRLRVEEPVFIEAVRVYPVNDTVMVKVDVCADRSFCGKITLCSEALKEAAVKEVSLGEAELQNGRAEVVFEELSLCDKELRWDEYEGNLYKLTATLEGNNYQKGNCKTEILEVSNSQNGNCKTAIFEVSDSPRETCNTTTLETSNFSKRITKTVTFGVRVFGDNGEGRFAVNGRTIFVRSEANCAEFPETGYIPMTIAEWKDILLMYKSYGINLVRFHSHCPPEAAFTAADDLGMLMQPELSHWDPKTAFETEECYQYYRAELLQILRMLANHPSFVMLTLGNELHASERGHERMQALLNAAREMDGTRLYADGSNVHYGAIGCDVGSDFYTSQKYYDEDLRGTHCNMEGYINRSYPNARTNYDNTMEHLRESYKKPVFSFEVGQFEVLPDFDELDDFQGISDPVNLRLIQERVKERRLLPVWKKYVEATGELSRICYREEIEAAMRTRELSGISLLGLQDFPGQGTALVGMLNSHLKPKPFDFAKPGRFRGFFTDQLPLVLLPKYTYENTESLKAQVQIANFGKTSISGCLEYVLQGEGVHINGKITGGNANKCTGASKESAEEYSEATGKSEEASGKKNGEILCTAGKLTDATTLEIPLDTIKKPTRLDLIVSIGECKNTYPIWVYPPVAPTCPDSVYETQHFDEQAKQALAEGKTVYLTPPSTKEALPNSIQAQFSTDFWSVGTFAGQEGGMGQLIDDKHPIFREFPTEFHTNWQWWIMASQRAVILPKKYECIITEMDSYAYLRHMTKLLECKCGNGKVLFSTMGLQDLQQYPESRALLASIYQYLDSEEFMPTQELEVEVLESLIK